VAVRTQPFALTIDGDAWHDHEPWLRRQYHGLMQSGIGRPMVEAQRDCTRLSKFLQKHMPDLSVPISPLIVFTHPDTSLEVINQPTAPVVYAGKRKQPSLKTHLRQPTDVTLSAAQIAQQGPHPDGQMIAHPRTAQSSAAIASPDRSALVCLWDSYLGWTPRRSRR
jgi:hypothetical protein